MKSLLSILACTSLLILHSSCTDQCEVTRTFETVVPKYYSFEQIRNGVRLESPKELERPAKLYVKDQYLFISEAKKGIHVIDNSNLTNPVKISFINVPGVLDMAVKNNTLYVDSFMDVVAIDISNPLDVKEIGRQKDVFNFGVFDGIAWNLDISLEQVIDHDKEIKTVTSMGNCGYQYEPPVYYDYRWNFGVANSTTRGPSVPSSNQSESTGTSGSMARFTLNEDYLYAVSQNSLELLNITDETTPKREKTIELNWGIETIFPYKDNLFIGSNSAMYIFDNTDRSQPKLLSIFPHSRACDPVVVQDDIAYVTLRSGSCGVTNSRLEVVDVKDLTTPKLIKTYDMDGPYGLGVYDQSLFICEGKNGLKSFDKTDVRKIELLQHIKDLDAYDVIPLSNSILLLVGKDGFYQYDFTDPANLKELSHIPVKQISNS